MTLNDINRRLAVVRAKERNVILMTGMARTGVVLIGSVMGYFLLDWIFELPIFGRWIAVIGCVVGVLYTFRRHVQEPLRKILDDDEVALRVEERNPDLRGRLISTIQLARKQGKGEFVGSPELIAALEQDTLEMAGPMDFLKVINRDMMVKFAVAAFVVLAINVVCVIRWPEHFQALALRLVDSEQQFPTKTRIREVIVENDGLIARGDSVTVTVRVDENFIVPEEPGLLVFRSLRDGAETPIELAPEGGAVFKGTLAKALEDMDMLAKVGDGRSQWQKVTVKQRPEIEKGQVRYIFPEYTGLGTGPVEDFGGLTAWMGSSADIRIETTKPLKEARVERFDGQVLAMVPVENDPQKWMMKEPFPIDKNTSYHITLVDTDGLTNSQPPVEYPVTAKPDSQPVMKLRRPSRDTSITPDAKIHVVFDARDDFGVRVVWLVFRVQKDGEEEGSGKEVRVERVIPVKDAEGRPIDRRALAEVPFAWDLSALRLRAGDKVIFWLEADDDCTTNDEMPMRRRPRDGEAEEELPAGPYYPRTADVKLTVLSKEDKISEIQAEIARLYQQLESISDRQSELKDKLREAIEALNKQIKDMK